ncbi:MAG: hypothetical protein J6T02_02070 [Bacteroidales bacterium]|nr:hypothetical protein [Bacteroidales bacterium]
MKIRITIIVAVILLIVNYLTGFILSAYDIHNVHYSSLAIIVTAILILLTSIPGLKEGFRVALPFIFAFLGIIEFFLGVFANHSLENNGYVIASMLLVALELSIFGICYVVSKHTK